MVKLELTWSSEMKAPIKEALKLQPSFAGPIVVGRRG
jgi:hypothetical protein